MCFLVSNSRWRSLECIVWVFVERIWVHVMHWKYEQCFISKNWHSSLQNSWYNFPPGIQITKHISSWIQCTRLRFFVWVNSAGGDVNFLTDNLLYLKELVDNHQRNPRKFIHVICCKWDYSIFLPFNLIATCVLITKMVWSIYDESIPANWIL